MLGHEPPTTMSLASVSGRRNEEAEEMEMVEVEEREVEEEHEEMEELHVQEQQGIMVEQRDGEDRNVAGMLERDEEEEEEQEGEERT